MACTHNQSIGIRSKQKRLWHGHCPSLKMSVNRASTISWIASCVIQILCHSIYPQLKYWQPLQVILWVSILVHLKISVNIASTDCQQSVNDFGHWILYNPKPLLWNIPVINVLASVLSKSDRDMVTAPVWKWASTERQRFCGLHLV